MESRGVTHVPIFAGTASDAVCCFGVGAGKEKTRESFALGGIDQNKFGDDNGAISEMTSSQQETAAQRSVSGRRVLDLPRHAGLRKMRYAKCVF